MAKFIRYALATVCFAASVGCLALWGWTTGVNKSCYTIQLCARDSISQLHAREGKGAFNLRERPSDPRAANAWDLRFFSYPREEWDEWFPEYPPQKKFGELPIAGQSIYFPLWYPALIFALAGVGVLRFRRQFSIRSGLICVSVVAVLLGMAVIL